MQHWAHSTSDPVNRPIFWTTNAVKNANAVPVFLDCSMGWAAGTVETSYPPPPCDAIPVVVRRGVDSGPFGSFCMNRHDGGINVLFLDWSVRKVGLKELWTLRWNKPWNTAGPWTKAGGVTPEQWPDWMRRLKDY